MKKLLLTLGTVAITSVSVVAAVSCGSSDPSGPGNNPEHFTGTDFEARGFHNLAEISKYQDKISKYALDGQALLLTKDYFRAWEEVVSSRPGFRYSSGPLFPGPYNTFEAVPLQSSWVVNTTGDCFYRFKLADISRFATKTADDKSATAHWGWDYPGVPVSQSAPFTLASVTAAKQELKSIYHDTSAYEPHPLNNLFKWLDSNGWFRIPAEELNNFKYSPVPINYFRDLDNLIDYDHPMPLLPLNYD